MVASLLGINGTTRPTPQYAPQPAATGKVTKQTLVDTRTESGMLDYGDAVVVGGRGSGIITWLPPVGSTITRGKTLYKVDEMPVILLYGQIPMYRSLKSGDKGSDVRQLTKNLRALGYAGFTTDDRYDQRTEAAVKRWQKTLDLPQTGVIDAERVVFTPAKARIAEHKVRIGAQAAADILTYTTGMRQVTVELKVTDQLLARKGTKVTVTLPTGKMVAGVVAGTANTVENGGGDQGAGGPGEGAGEPKIRITVTVADQAELGTLHRSPVDVQFIAQKRKDVLTVPVAALLALSEGGYGVEVVDGNTTRVVAVETGMFANGRVEIRGDISDGTAVTIPS